MLITGNKLWFLHPQAFTQIGVGAVKCAAEKFQAPCGGDKPA